MPTLIYKNGDKKQVGNLSWLIRNSKKVQRIDLDKLPKRHSSQSRDGGRMTAHLDNGKSFVCNSDDYRDLRRFALNPTRDWNIRGIRIVENLVP